MIQKKVQEFYDRGTEYEWNRLSAHPVEFEITIRHLSNYIQGTQIIADIGGGPGKYSFHFANEGHKVTLVDLSKNNIDFAKHKSKELNIELEAFHTLSATKLTNIESSKYDLVLCFGPMYHLENKRDHHDVITECSRILKTNGVLAIVYLTPWSHAFSAIINAPEKINIHKEYYEDLINNLKNTTQIDIGFPNGWNPKPDTVKGYMENHYFKTERIVAIEGLLGRHLEKIKDKVSDTTFNNWMDYIFKLSTETSLIGACEHLLYIGRKLH